MATFFGRRYARPLEAVRSTERRLGAAILLLLAAIVLAAVVQVATDRSALFAGGDTESAASGPAEADRGAPPVAGPRAPDESGRPGAATAPWPTLPDWRAEPVERYGPDQLYLKIDGRAELFLEHHVLALSCASYRHRDEADRVIDVYWYDMGAPENALAIYQREAAAELPPLPFSRAGYQVEGAVFFCQAASYVQVLPSRGQADAQPALALARAIAEAAK